VANSNGTQRIPTTRSSSPPAPALESSSGEIKSGEREIIRTGRPIIGKAEQEFWKTDGRVTWALTTKMPLRNEKGEIVGTFGIMEEPQSPEAFD
jgi:hypothetical protein